MWSDVCFLNLLICICFRTDDMIRFQTPPYRIGKVTIKLRWSNAYERPDSKDFFKDFEFEYRPNPVVSSVQSIESFER